MHVQGQRVYGKFLLLPLSFAKSLKLLQKSKSILKKKKDYYDSCIENKTNPSEGRSRENSKKLLLV